LNAFPDRDPTDPLLQMELTVFTTLHYKAWVGGGTFNSAADIDQFNADVEIAIPELQQAVRELLTTITPERPCWLARPIGEGVLWRPDSGLVFVTRTAGVPRVLAIVVSILLAIGPRLRRCLQCRRLFGYRRPQQQCCSTKCSNLRRQRKHRQQHPESSEARHARHARTVKRRLPHAKVRRHQRARK
jgi:hypothetical protein